MFLATSASRPPKNIYKQYNDIKTFLVNFEDRRKSKKMKGFRF